MADPLLAQSVVPARRRGALYTRPWFWVLIALIPRLLYLLEQGTESPLFFQPLLDELESVESAQAILRGDSAEEPLFKAPGYAILLAGVMGLSGDAWPWTIRLLQHVCGALLAGITAGMARRLTPARVRDIAGIATGVLISFYGPLIRLESCLLLDFWSVFFQTAMVAAAVAILPRNWKRQVLLATILAGTSILVRPTLLATIPILAAALGWMLWRWSRRRALLGALLFLAGPFAALAAMGLYNINNNGAGMVLPWQGGYSFYQANKTGANGRYFSQATIDTSGGANPARELALRGYMDSQTANLGPNDGLRGTGIYLGVSPFWMDKAKAEIRSDAARWLRLMFSKGVNLFANREIFNIEEYHVQRSLSSILPFCFIGFGFVWPLALAGLASWKTRTASRSRQHIFAWCYVLFLGGAIALYFVSGRMRMPIVPVLVALGTGGTAALWLRLTRKTAVAAAALASVGIVWSYGNWFGVNSEDMAHVDYLRLSNASWRNGDHKQALAFATEAEKLVPNYPTIPLMKAQATYGLGQYAVALQLFAKAGRRLPTDPMPWYNSGIIQHYHEKNFEQALSSYRRALALKPDYPNAAWRAALLHLSAGEITQAERLLQPYQETLHTAKPPAALKAAGLMLESARSGIELKPFSHSDTAYAESVNEELGIIAPSRHAPQP